MKVLIIEDEPELASSICQYLDNEHVICEVAVDYHTALRQLEVHEYDCIVLDIGLPGGSGLQILEAFKKDGKAEGLLIVSARSSLDDRVEGLQLGADDYLAKPFHLPEPAARAAAIVRRKSFGGATLLNFDKLAVNLSGKVVHVGDERLDLTRKEYELLLYFISNKGRVVSKGAIAEHLWAELTDIAANYDFIYTHIKNLRKKLDAAGCPDYIQSVYGMGYKFRQPVIKLATRYNRINVSVTLVVFLIASAIFYNRLQRIFIHQLDEDLEIEMAQFEAYVAHHGYLPKVGLIVPDQMTRYEPTTAPPGGARFRTTMLLDKAEGHSNLFREVTFPVQVGNVRYLVTISKSLETTDALMRAILITAAVTVLLMLGVVVLLNRIVLRRLWAPFYASLQAFRKFKVGDATPELPATRTTEFGLMNGAKPLPARLHRIIAS